MSFILDALRKADRERTLSKIPTLATVHIPVYVAGRRIVPWIVGAMLLVGGALAWFLVLPSRGPSVSPAPVGAPTSVAVAPPARAGDSGAPAAARESSGPPPIAAAPAPPVRPPAWARPDGGLPFERGAPPSPRTGRPMTRQAPPPPLPIETEEPAVLPVQPEAPPPPLVSGAQVRSEAIPNRPEAPPPVASPAPVQRTPTLQEALSRLRLDVFVYTEIEADRMVIINGRRYVKGELVEGVYLLDDITPEGAVLRHGGERAVLYP